MYYDDGIFNNILINGVVIVIGNGYIIIKSILLINFNFFVKV